jgi:hypothetical protein
VERTIIITIAAILILSNCASSTPTSVLSPKDDPTSPYYVPPAPIPPQLTEEEKKRSVEIITHVPTANGHNCRPLRDGEISMSKIMGRVSSCNYHGGVGGKRTFYIQVGCNKKQECGKVVGAFISSDDPPLMIEHERKVMNCIIRNLKMKDYKHPTKFGCYSIRLALDR